MKEPPMTRSGLMVVVLGLALLGGPVAAHHSFTAEFNPDKPARLQGTVANVEWVNPHALISLLVSDGPATSEMTTWKVELSPPNALTRLGLTRNDITPGTELIVDGFLARDGQAKLGSTSVTIR